MLTPRKPYDPRPYQGLATSHLLDTPRCALWASMGMGKSVATYTALDALYVSGTETQPALVLAPKRVARSTWPNEAAKWAHLSDIVVSPVIGTESERAAALKRDASVYTLNYENLPWLVDHLAGAWPFGTIVADESTRLKNARPSVQTSATGKTFLRAAGGMRARALARVAFRSRRFIELTGTPAPNGVADLWGQAWFLDQGVRLGRTHESFIERWFRPKRNGYGSEPLAHALPEIHEKLRDVVLTLEAKDWFDLREPIVNVIRVELPPRGRKLYRDMERQMFMQLDGHDVEAFNAASRTIKCLQLANGAAFVDQPDDYHDAVHGARKWAAVHDAKLEAVDSVITEAAGMPVLVAYHFKPDLARLRAAFPQGRTLDTKQDEDDWNAGKIPVAFVHPASAGHGLNLQDGGNIIAVFGLWWDLETHAQVIERIGPVRQLQSGHDRPVFIHYIVAAGTVDEDVLARLQTKRETQDILLDAMKRFNA